MDLFEILDKKFDIKQQVDGLNKMMFSENVSLYGGRYRTFAYMFNSELFRQWEYNQGRLSLGEILQDLNMLKYIDATLPKPIANEHEAHLALQLDLNIVSYAKKHKKVFVDYLWNDEKFFNEIGKKISYIFDKCNLKCVKHPKEDYYLIAPLDEKTQAVAEKTDENTAFLICEYNSILLKGNVDRKREILKLLSNKIEPIIKSRQSNGKADFEYKVFNDLAMVFNNFEIRHSNLDPNNVGTYKPTLASYTNKQWEEIYDATYQLILDALLIEDYSTTLSKIVAKHKKAIITSGE